MGNGVKVTVRGMRGYKPQSIFRLFDDGIRKRLPAKIAESYKALVINNIDNNTFGFQLSFDWVKRKERLGADTRPFIMYGHYRNNITAMVDDGHLVVGFKKKVMHPRAKVPMGELAMRLEYGDLSRGLPARPLWRKSFQQFQERLKRDGAGIFRDSVKL